MTRTAFEAWAHTERKNSAWDAVGDKDIAFEAWQASEQRILALLESEDGVDVAAEGLYVASREGKLKYIPKYKDLPNQMKGDFRKVTKAAVAAIIQKAQQS